MIEFCGQISGRCKQYVLRRESKIRLIAGFITAAIFSIPMITLAFTVHWIFIISLPALIMMALLAGMPPNKNNYDLIMPSSVVINSETGKIVSKSDKFHYVESIDKVKHIADYGEWYYIFFENKNGRFICQKDLICQGTLADFEALFDGKIVKNIE